LINIITEVSPANVLAFLWSLEIGNKLIEFVSTQDNFSHVQSNSKLSLGDISTSELIKVSEKFTNSNSLLFALLSELSKDIFNIIWNIFFDINTSNSWSILWIVIK
jgi:hypothetical protein